VDLVGESKAVWSAPTICGGRGKEREGGEHGGGRCAVRVGENERIRVRVRAATAYMTKDAAGRGSLGWLPRFRPAK